MHEGIPSRGSLVLFGALLCALLGALTAGLGACMVQGRCFGDMDCPGAQICEAGTCRFACSGDEDCEGCRRCEDRHCTECCRDSDCADDEHCVEEVCLPAPGCLGCDLLPHGTGACWHGLCIVSTCDGHPSSSVSSDSSSSSAYWVMRKNH